MKLIHTADIHLDASFAAAGMPAGFGNRRRQSLRDVLSAILRRAKEWPADAVLLAGDLFEHDRVSRDTIAFLREQFEALRPIPVFIAPGNHDPYVLSSPYATEAWPANVHIFRTPEWTEDQLKNVPLTVHGFGFDGPEISRNPFAELQVRDDGRVHVAVAHGSERGHQPAGKNTYAPFDAYSLAQAGLNYVALGHFHAFTPIETPTTQFAYSGAPEGHGFDEPGPRHYLEIEIEDLPDGTRRTHVKPVLASKVQYLDQTIDCSGFSSSHPLIEALRDIAREAGQPLILRADLVGASSDSFRAEMPTVMDVIGAEFNYLELNDETSSAEDLDALACEDTSLGLFVRRIRKEINEAPDDARRAVLERALEVGLAGYRGHLLPVRGLAKEAR